MTTKEFVQYANEHPEICEKFSVCTSSDETYALACNEGLTDSKEEFVAEITKLKESVQLSDEDLDNISGGSAESVITVSAVTVSSTVVSLFAATLV